jgi:hypothetical protein
VVRNIALAFALEVRTALAEQARLGVSVFHRLDASHQETSRITSIPAKGIRTGHHQYLGSLLDIAEAPRVKHPGILPPESPDCQWVLGDPLLLLLNPEKASRLSN